MVLLQDVCTDIQHDFLDIGSIEPGTVEAVALDDIEVACRFTYVQHEDLGRGPIMGTLLGELYDSVWEVIPDIKGMSGSVVAS